jgi:hypothetical protein
VVVPVRGLARGGGLGLGHTNAHEYSVNRVYSFAGAPSSHSRAEARWTDSWPVVCCRAARDTALAIRAYGSQ